MKTSNLLSILLLLLFAYQSAIACSCYDYDVPDCKRFSEADAVFIGKVERIVKQSGQAGGTKTKRNRDGTVTITIPLRTIHVKIEKAFKGVQDEVVKILATEGTSCDLSINKGERWFMFASKDEDTGYYSVGFCSGSHQISKELTKFKYFEELAGEKTAATIIGRLSKNRFKEITDAKVFLTGNDLSLNTQTDSMGFYNFDVPPGKYKIKIVVPFAARTMSSYNSTLEIKQTPTETETSFEYEADASARNCHYAYLDTFEIDVKASAAITGRFVSPGISAFPKMIPEICRLQETEEATLSGCRWDYRVKPDGSFEFGILREGKYIIVINKKNFPDFDTPFHKYYYPGVENFSDAQIINLKQGQKLAISDFNLPPPPPTAEVKGKIFWKNKKAVLPTDLDDEGGVLFNFYNPLGRDFIFSMQDRLFPSQENKNGLKLGSDGSFAFRGFTGHSYLVRISARNKNGKTYYKETEIKIDENSNFLEMILDTPEKD